MLVILSCFFFIVCLTIYTSHYTSYYILLKWIGLHSTLETRRIRDMSVTINSCFQGSAPASINRLINVRNVMFQFFFCPNLWLSIYLPRKIQCLCLPCIVTKLLIVSWQPDCQCFFTFLVKRDKRLNEIAPNESEELANHFLGKKIICYCLCSNILCSFQIFIFYLFA